MYIYMYTINNPLTYLGLSLSIDMSLSLEDKFRVSFSSIIYKEGKRLGYKWPIDIEPPSCLEDTETFLSLCAHLISKTNKNDASPHLASKASTPTLKRFLIYCTYIVSLVTIFCFIGDIQPTILRAPPPY